MYKPSTNIEASESQAQLCSALFALLAHRCLDDITVTELCRRAGVSRNAFYRNFTGTEDILVYRVDRECLDFMAGCPASFTSPEEYFAFFFEFWLARRDVLNAFFANNRTHLLLERLARLTEDTLQWPMERRDRTPMKGHIFLASGLTGMLYFYLKTKCEIAPQRLAHWLAENIQYGFSETEGPSSPTEGAPSSLV